MSRNCSRSERHDGVESDRTSERDDEERRVVDPYRGQREALIARRRVLGDELAEAERVLSRREEIASEIHGIDAQLRDRTTALLDAIAIPTRCRARWDDMVGNEVVRHCGKCHREVHDLSRMTRAEIEALLGVESPLPCVRLRRRPDGRVVTADCPVEAPSVAARALRTVTAGVLFGASAGVAATIASLPVLGGAHVAPAELPVVAAPREEAQPIDLQPFGAVQAPPDESDEATTGLPMIDVAPATASTMEEDLDRSIRWIAPQAWEVDRELILHRLEASTRTLHRSPLFIPHEANGRVVGVKVYGVRRSAVLGRLGFQNGDMLIDINGHPASSPDAALEVLASLRTTDAFFVRLERRGRERLHVYRIAD